MSPRRRFDDLYAHGMARVAAAVPRVALADPARNAAETARLWRAAATDGAALVVFPELGLTGYTIADLHQQDAVHDAVLSALAELAAATREHATLLAVGAPLRFEQRLFNCAVVLAGGRVLGVVPKSYLPDYREYYEKRQFVAAADADFDEVSLLAERVPFGTDLLFACRDLPELVLAVELCEDLWVPLPPSIPAALAGATVLANLSASNVTIAKADYRRELVTGQSARCLAAYVYAGAGLGESTTDVAWDGHAMIAENGNLLAETERFAAESRLLTADLDLERLAQDRLRMTSFRDCRTAHRATIGPRRRVEHAFAPSLAPVPLRRAVPRRPYVPADERLLDERCYEAYHIQVQGLAQRLAATGIERAVIGVSGGLDSTQALIVTARAMDRLGLPRTNVLAYTMPGYATSARTLASARRLMAALGVSAHELDVRPACDRMLADIDHPYARGEEVYDTTFENVQAGERTSHLFRLANRHGALVVGTGDLSELALGWCTYGVGDHMSHYGVNASVPKTLVRHLIAWEAAKREVDPETAAVLRDVLATDISPELVPGADPDAIAQRTEELIGPFDLHDFFLYYTTRLGYRPSKTAYLCAHAWARAAEGERAYDVETILRWLEVFLTRFFARSQFKRSALPDGPKVGSGGALSPRGDWRAPSDAGAAPWLADLAATRAWIARDAEGAE